MGYRMAGHLLKAGHDVALWSHTGSKAQQLAKTGKGTAVATAREVAEGADVISYCVGDTGMAQQITRGSGGLLETVRKRAIICDCSSIAPEATIELNKPFAAKGAHFLDSPVTGSTGGADKATLTFMIGG